MNTNLSKAVKKLRPNLLAAPFVGLVSLGLTIPYAFRDPDPHHDGIQYGAALGVSEGLQIQSEIFGQYGPVTPWLQGFALWLIGPELIWIRLLNALLIAATALLMFLILNRTIRNEKISSFVPLAWVASSPDWSVAPGIFQFWPWPSTLYGFFAALSLYLWICSRDLEPASKKSKSVLFFSGLIVGLSGFTRSQNGLLLYLAISLALLVVDRKNNNGIVNFIYFSLGTLASGGMIIIYLLLSGSLDDFINQAIIGAANNYAGQLYNASFLWEYYYVPAVLFSILGFFFYKIFASLSRKSTSFYLIASALYLMLILVLFIKTDSPQVDELLQLSNLKGSISVSPVMMSTIAAVATIVAPLALIIRVINKKYFAALNVESNPSKRYPAVISSLLVSSVLVTFALLVAGVREPYRVAAFATLVIPLSILFLQLWKDVVRHSRRDPGRHEMPDEFVVPLSTSLIAIATITQIFPVHDPYHLWWAAPIPIVSAIICGYLLLANRKAFFSSVTLISLVSLLLGLVPWKTELSEGRVKINAGSLKYMYVTSERVKENSEILKLLHAVDSNSATFYCRDGLVATWTGRYMASSPRFVDWAWGTASSNPKSDEKVFLCVHDSMETGRAWADQNGYIFGNGIQTNFSYFSSFYLVELIRKSE